MKLKYILGATALSLLFAGTAYPQQDQEKEKDKPAQQEEKRSEPAKQQPAQKQEQKTQQQSAKQQQQQEKQQKNETKNEQKQTEQANQQRQEQQKQLTKQQQQEQKQQQKQQQQVAKQRQDTEQQARQDQHSDRDRGRRIPDDRFRASFGREHHFHVEHADNRRFHYGGYWFTFTDAWPVGWAYTDDCYIDYIDGQYYLIDLFHPGFQLLLVID